MRVFWAILSIGFSLLLYGLFGVLCGVGYKAVQEESYEPVLETSPKLRNFLMNERAKSSLFSLNDIQYGIVDIMFKQAAKNTKAGEPIVLSAVPAVLLGDDKRSISVVIPVAFNSVFGMFYTGVVFDFDTSEKLHLRDVKIGGARLPRVVGNLIAEVIQERYENSFGDFFDDVDDLKIAFEKDGIRLTKQ